MMRWYCHLFFNQMFNNSSSSFLLELMNSLVKKKGGVVTTTKSYIAHEIDFLKIILELKNKY